MNYYLLLGHGNIFVFQFVSLIWNLSFFTFPNSFLLISVQWIFILGVFTQMIIFLMCPSNNAHNYLHSKYDTPLWSSFITLTVTFSNCLPHNSREEFCWHNLTGIGTSKGRCLSNQGTCQNHLRQWLLFTCKYMLWVFFICSGFR